MFCWAVEMGKGSSDTEKFCAVPQGIRPEIITVYQLNHVMFCFPSRFYSPVACMPMKQGPEFTLQVPACQLHHLTKTSITIYDCGIQLLFCLPICFHLHHSGKKPEGCLKQETQAYVTKGNFVVGWLKDDTSRNIFF